MKTVKNLLISCALLFSIPSFAQMDTLSYLKQFGANKVRYVGKPFSTLLSEMTEIQPLVSFSDSPFQNKNIRMDTRFKFDTKNMYSPNAIALLVTWETPIPTTEVNYYRDKNKSKFTKDERSFFGSRIKGHQGISLILFIRMQNGSYYSNITFLFLLSANYH